MKSLLIPAVLLGLSACQQAAAPLPQAEVQPAVAVSDAWCRPSPNGAKAGACYVTVISDMDDRLIGGSTPQAGSIQIHEMSMAEGVMKMGELTGGLELKAGQAVALAPGGNHLMLIGLKAPMVAGTPVPLTLTFADAPAVTVQASVGQPVGRSGERPVPVG